MILLVSDFGGLDVQGKRICRRLGRPRPVPFHGCGNARIAGNIPGRGQIDYRAYLSELAKLPVDAPLMLEHLKTAEEYAEGRNYIQGVARQLGLSFGA